ncbi:rod-binding protein, partial [Geminisphaera colitermitum]|uniref:rod-binding protein n=1 Tax=Geminisphaera colitermitum TaxID=1148786 RepID=UPI0005BE1E0D
AAELHRAAAQFEAILIRQLLAPALNSLTSGNALSSSSPSAPGATAGSGIYGYMLTDVMAQSLSQNGGLGLARVIEQQLSPSRATRGN